jgi:hypothetical protein
MSMPKLKKCAECGKPLKGQSTVKCEGTRVLCMPCFNRLHPPGKPRPLLYRELWVRFQTEPNTLTELRAWRPIMHRSCELFGHSNFTSNTLERLTGWLQERHGQQSDVFGIPLADVSEQLGEVIGQPPKEEDWLPASEALYVARARGYDITLDWISKRKDRILTRRPQLSSKHRLEVEMGSLAKVLFTEAKRKAMTTDTDEPEKAEREGIEARMQAEQRSKRRS